MTLPARQRRMLDGIEGALQASEPRMASMFGIFTRLSEGDQAALPERLPRSRLRIGAGFRSFLLLPVVFAMLITGVVLGGTARGSNCGGARVTGVSMNRVAAARARTACNRPSLPAAQVSRVSPGKPSRPVPRPG